MMREEGPGWRLAKDHSRRDFPFLLGGEKWAFELTEAEWKTLFPIIDELITQHKKLTNQLMPSESLCLEMERESWWACLDGPKESWTLQLILRSKDNLTRSIEAFWPIPASQSLANAMRKIWDSTND